MNKENEGQRGTLPAGVVPKEVLNCPKSDGVVREDGEVTHVRREGDAQLHINFAEPEGSESVEAKGKEQKAVDTPSNELNPETADVEEKVKKAEEKKHKEIMALLTWPFTATWKVWKALKAKYDNDADDVVKERVCSLIRIEDAVVDGTVVVALKVGEVVIDYVRHYQDKDPEGYYLCDGVNTLLKRMQQIRKNEYVRRKVSKKG